MIWYKAYHGSWRDPEGIRLIDCGSDRGKVFQEAQKVANTANKIVTVSAEWPSACGLECRHYEVIPEIQN